jgi:hypothetical protein
LPFSKPLALALAARPSQTGRLIGARQLGRGFGKPRFGMAPGAFFSSLAVP